MTIELSKQLCELCGLPYEKEVIDPKQKQLADHGDPRFSTPSLIKVTLDFTKPENFIRLFNLKWYLPDDEYGTQEAGLAFYVLFNYGNSSQDWNTEGFIRILIEILQNTRSELYIKYIKLSIREAEWVYG